jgi:hypothetical protein
LPLYAFLPEPQIAPRDPHYGHQNLTILNGGYRIYSFVGIFRRKYR